MLHIRSGSQVQIWRRSFDVLPPPMDTDHKHYNEIASNPKFRAIKDKIPQTESLETTMLRVIPFWDSTIVPDIKSGKRVLVVCHGTSLRGIVKHVDRELTACCYRHVQ
jgi:2,3-bisphosphoglycerate-dependent phosphoglycerate mutase